MRDLFAGIPVSEFEPALTWYKRLLGTDPAFYPHATEAVWKLAENRYIYIVEDPENAGHALVTCLVDDLEGLIKRLSAQGITPLKDERFPNSMRKLTYEDQDGNQVGFGGVVDTP